MFSLQDLRTLDRSEIYYDPYILFLLFISYCFGGIQISKFFVWAFYVIIYAFFLVYGLFWGINQPQHATCANMSLAFLPYYCSRIVTGRNQLYIMGLLNTYNYLTWQLFPSWRTVFPIPWTYHAISFHKSTMH